MLKRSYISGLGFNVPDNIVKNDDLTKYMDTSDEWIYERSGIKERRIVESHENNGIGPADLSVPAVEKSPELYAKFDDATTPVVILPPSIVPTTLYSVLFL